MSNEWAMYLHAACGNESDGIMRRALSHLRCNEQGQAIVEFALVAGFLVILLVSILEMSLFLYTYATLTDAAKEGVRYAVVHGSSATTQSGPSSTQAVVSAVQTYTAVSLHTVVSTNVQVNYLDDSNAPGSRVQVSINYPFQPLFLVNWARVTISATSVGRIQF